MAKRLWYMHMAVGTVDIRGCKEAQPAHILDWQLCLWYAGVWSSQPPSVQHDECLMRIGVLSGTMKY